MVPLDPLPSPPHGAHTAHHTLAHAHGAGCIPQVLLRTIELSTQRILGREPNIFVATGPSVFTDAFIDYHQEQELMRAGTGKQAPSTPRRLMYASRTSMEWGQRLAFLERHGAINEDSGTLRATYEGYDYADVYADGADERYLPTWGTEPTRGLYKPLPFAALPPMPPMSSAPAPVATAATAATAPAHGAGATSAAAAAAGASADGGASVLAGTYYWHGSDDCAELGGVRRVSWRCILELAPTSPATARAPSSEPVAVLRSSSHESDAADAVEASPCEVASTARPLAYAGCRFLYLCEREVSTGDSDEEAALGIASAATIADGAASGTHATRAAGDSEVEYTYGEMRGAWRCAPGKREQLHLFEWTLVDPPEAAVGAPELVGRLSPPPHPLTQVEAPSVMVVSTPAHMQSRSRAGAGAGAGAGACAGAGAGAGACERSAEKLTLNIEGWLGGRELDGLANRLGVARGASARSSGLQLPMVFVRQVVGA